MAVCLYKIGYSLKDVIMNTRFFRPARTTASIDPFRIVCFQTLTPCKVSLENVYYNHWAHPIKRKYIAQRESSQLLNLVIVHIISNPISTNYSAQHTTTNCS
jgi:hypothetical protein